ncbi:MAG: hypothetical protein QF535_08800, partial [Anaerolineales bacterium]|nr:hypothetical protein [Anaerolineales bacterium]
NDFTPTNLVATDQMVDSPTNNFCTMNSVTKPQTAQTFSEGNLKIVPDSNWEFGAGTFQMVSGKWYWELRAKSSSVKYGILVDYADLSANQELGIQYYPGNKIVDSTWSSYGATYGDGDIIGYACDMDGSTITFYKNGVSQGAIAFSGALTTAPAAIFGGGLHGTSGGANFNFGADSSFAGEETAQNNTDDNGCGDFYYAPPSGYLALCSNNLPDPEIALPGENFNTLLWTGDAASSRSITGLGFQADMMWSKVRTGTHQHNVVDRVRGVDQRLIMPNSTAAEDTTCTQGWFDSLDSDGWSMTYGGASGWNTNKSGEDYVGWAWKAGGAPTATNSAGAGATPTAGSVKIDGSNLGSALAGTLAATKLSANTTSGFSIVEYTSTGGGSPGTQTVAHGLSGAPEMIIVKSTDSTYDWTVYSSASSLGNTRRLVLNSDAARATAGDWEDTTPSASVFTIGDGTSRTNDGSSTYTCYCFQPVEGYSKVGSYTGNTNADGAFIYTGFRPAFVLVKCTTAVKNWILMNNKMPEYNVVDEYLM